MIAPHQILRTISGGKVRDVATGTGGFIHFLIEGLKEFNEIITVQGITHRETYTRAQLIAIMEALNLRPLTLTHVCDLSGDPKDPELIQELSGIIDRYIERATGLPEAARCNRAVSSCGSVYKRSVFRAPQH